MALSEQIDNKRIPAHIAVIMDGNGRWAKRKGLLRTSGHEKGVETVSMIVEECAKIGVRYLTLYAFSTENWNRPKYEVNAIMNILVKSLAKEEPTLMKNGIRLSLIGDIDSLPKNCRTAFTSTMNNTCNNNRLNLILALSYSSRMEILRGVKKLATDVQNGILNPDQITESLIEQSLYTAGIPDPELLIRTSGEQRISNFLLWQIAYSELYFSEKLWPEFSREDFYSAIIDFQNRERRFGLTSEQLINTNA